jgi:hypothetical protein
MFKVSIRDTAGTLIAEGTCSDSGFFPPAVAGIYNAALQREPARSLRVCDTSSDTWDYPEGVRRARFGYLETAPAHREILDDEVVLHVERL